MIFIPILVLVILYFVYRGRKKKQQEELKKLQEELKKLQDEIASLNEKLKPINDLEAAISDLEMEKGVLTLSISKLLTNKIDLSKEIEQLKKLLDGLKKEESLYDFGLYEFHYDFASSQTYKVRLESIREAQKSIGKADKIIILPPHDIRSDTGRYLKDVSKLMIRLFNSECDNLFSKIKFNNIVNIEDKLTKLKENIDKFGKNFRCEISKEFFELKIQELHLIYEYQETLEAEREEQRAIKEQIREEDKARKEAERVEREADAESKRYEELLSRAKDELSRATDSDMLKLKEEIEALQAQLDEAKLLKERAMSMAQQTRAGYVYIISNIGSFGENVYKIGMTRRLEPMDRVKELGDASVPFSFDVHALIPSQDAPTLESKLQKKFNNLRLNRINERKEFFRVSLEDIEKIVKESGYEIEFTKTALAQEYRETLSLLDKERNN